MEVKRHKNGSKEADPDQPNTWEGGIPIVVPGFPPPGQPNLSTGQPRCWEELGRLESWELGSQKIKRREKCDFPLVFKPTSLVRSFMPPYYKYTSSCLFATKPSPFSWSPLCRTSLPCPSHCRKPLQAKKKNQHHLSHRARLPLRVSHPTILPGARRGLASTLARQKPQDDEFSAELKAARK